MVLLMDDLLEKIWQGAKAGELLGPFPDFSVDEGQALQLQLLDKWIADGEKLAGQIRTFYRNRRQLETMGQAAQKLGRPEASRMIVDECYALVGRRQTTGSLQ